MLALYVVSLMAGLALGARLMLAGVLKDPGPAPVPQDARGRARARLLSPMGAAVLVSVGLTGGALTRAGTWSVGPRLAVALAAGAVAALIAIRVRAWALDPSAPADPDDDPRYVVQGLPAVVTQTITPEANGAIRWEHDGRAYTGAARSLEGEVLPVGTEVVIDRLEDGMAWVESWTRVEARL
jgi:hypothetical protein